MKTFLKYSEFLFESLIKEDSAVDDRVEKLSKDPEVQKKLGSSDSAKLKHALMVLFKRGYGAAQTNWGAVRPEIKALGKPAAYIAWGYARMNAFINKKKAYSTSDKDAADWLEGKGEKPDPK
jgi:hypothetical protein